MRVCTSMHLRAHTCEQWNTAIALKKYICFFFLAYPSQNVVKTKIPLDKSVSVALDFVAYLTCQPCLCKQTLPCRVTRGPELKKNPHRINQCPGLEKKRHSGIVSYQILWHLGRVKIETDAVTLKSSQHLRLNFDGRLPCWAVVSFCL